MKSYKTFLGIAAGLAIGMPLGIYAAKAAKDYFSFDNASFDNVFDLSGDGGCTNFYRDTTAMKTAPRTGLGKTSAKLKIRG